MQHLLDFVHEHTLEEQLFFVVDTSVGELELLWQRRVAPEHWQLRFTQREGPAELVPRAQMLSVLETRRADVASVERELNSLVATQIAFADMVLSDADALLGHDVVRRAVRGHQEFIGQPQAAIEQLTAPPRPKMTVLAGGGVPSATRSGHLTVVQ
jgi:hypothetical protein